MTQNGHWPSTALKIANRDNYSEALWGHQSIGAQLGHQPTPGSVKRADAKAQKSFDAALTRAKTLDEKGKRKCVRALAYAKRLFNLQ